MTKLVALAAALTLAGPAFATTAMEMSDTQLQSVAAGTGSLAPVTAINVNASPIIVTQLALALNFQTASLNMHGHHGHGKAFGLVKQSQFAVASNTANITSTVVQANVVH